MKSLLLTFALIFTFAFSTFAQKSENFIVLGHSESTGATFYVNPLEVSVKGDYIEFFGLIVLDENNFLLTKFSGNCVDMTYKVLVNKGKTNGESFEKPSDQPNYAQAKEHSFIHAALKTVCGKGTTK